MYRESSTRDKNIKVELLAKLSVLRQIFPFVKRGIEMMPVSMQGSRIQTSGLI